MKEVWMERRNDGPSRDIDLTAVDRDFFRTLTEQPPTKLG
jgi:hypothetical protein